MSDPETLKLTTAQAIVRYLSSQYIEVEGEHVRLCAGGFGIFGHGNVTCLGEALYEHREELPLYRGQNEQSMAMAAIGFTKQQLRRRFMFATASAGPGTTNMLTAAGIAHTNRMPILLLCGDTFVTRLPDPVLQQVENYYDPTLSVNDAFRPVSRFWDRITHPAQVMQSLPMAINTMMDPADCGPAFIGLPQDVQGWAYDYPAAFFAPRIHRLRRQAPDIREIAEAAECLRSAERPLIIAGGGVQYSGAAEVLRAFAEKLSIPVVETIAGRANLLHDHPLNCGPIGVTGSDSANALAARADVILAVGTRLQDFTTGSWSAFDGEARILSINAARHDAAKHFSLAVVGDARTALEMLEPACADYAGPASWLLWAAEQRNTWQEYVSGNVAAITADGVNRAASYAQVIGAVNAMCDPEDRVVAAAGGLPAEVTANWRTLSLGSVDVEFGFSCMGYEIAGGWGARIGQSIDAPDKNTIVFVGDGSYLLMNSDIYSSVLTGKKLIILVCDNGGFAVINKLQKNTGNASFNNLIEDCRLAVEPFAVDFAMHARSMGADSETVGSIEEMKAAFGRAKQSERTYVISIQVDAHEGWTTQGHTWWEVGLPEVSERPTVTDARSVQADERWRQRRGI